MSDSLRDAENRLGLQALAFGTQDQFCRPCVDCGLITGCFCDGDGEECYAAVRMPQEDWAPNQLTPLCTACDRRFDMCHFCRGIPWVTPLAHRDRDRHQPAGLAGRLDPPVSPDQPIYYLVPEGTDARPHHGVLGAPLRGPYAGRPLDPRPPTPGSRTLPTPKAPPTAAQIAGYNSNNQGARRAKAKATPDAAYRAAERELIDLLGADPLDDDPIDP